MRGANSKFRLGVYVSQGLSADGESGGSVLTCNLSRASPMSNSLSCGLALQHCRTMWYRNAASSSHRKFLPTDFDFRLTLTYIHEMRHHEIQDNTTRHSIASTRTLWGASSSTIVSRHGGSAGQRSVIDCSPRVRRWISTVFAGHLKCRSREGQ